MTTATSSNDTNSHQSPANGLGQPRACRRGSFGAPHPGDPESSLMQSAICASSAPPPPRIADNRSISPTWEATPDIHIPTRSQPHKVPPYHTIQRRPGALARRREWAAQMRRSFWRGENVMPGLRDRRKSNHAYRTTGVPIGCVHPLRQQQLCAVVPLSELRFRLTLSVRRRRPGSASAQRGAGSASPPRRGRRRACQTARPSAGRRRGSATDG